jgi:cellulose synthase/poly-beta-1,6-N-acetylglucosamine synthase-like glycosyltransferase
MFTLLTVLILAFLIIYPYTLYPLILKLFVTARQHIENTNFTEREPPSLSIAFLICVFNGEEIIEKKINNILNLSGYKDDCHIYIVSDHSSDKTDQIVSNLCNDRIRLIRCPSRYGKTKAENYALNYISSDIIIFSDATTMFDDNLLAHILPHFSNPRVGCVSTTDKIYTSYSENISKPSQEGIYVKYEMLLRKLETQLDVLTGASGSGYACRRTLAVEIPQHLTRDLFVPLYAYQNGMISVSDEMAICYIYTKSDYTHEITRKIRTFTNGIDTLMYMKNLLNPFKFGLFAYCLVSHKLLRWFGGILMILLYIASLLGSGNIYIAGFFSVQTMVHLYSFFRYKGILEHACGYCDTIYYFVVTNIATLIAWHNHIRNIHFAVWEPTKR